MTQEEKDRKVILGIVLAIILIIVIILLVSCSNETIEDNTKKNTEDPTIIDKKGEDEGEDLEYYPSSYSDTNYSFVGFSKPANTLTKTTNITHGNSLITDSEINNAELLVIKAEKSLLQEDLDNAREVVNKLTDEKIKNELNDRLDVVQNIINIENTLNELESLLQNASSKTDINSIATKLESSNIYDLISTLNETNTKDNFINRVDSLESIVLDNNNPVVKKPVNGEYYNKKVNISILDENTYTTYLNGKEYTKNNISTEGNYTLKVIDAAFNETIINFVIDKTAPQLTLNGNSEINITANMGESYTELGAESNDNIDGKKTINAPTSIIYYDENGVSKVVNKVDVNVIGRYDLTYTSVDKAGNSSSIVRVVKVNSIVRPTEKANVYLSIGNNKLENLTFDEYNDTNITMNGNKIINLKTVLNQTQINNNAIVNLTLETANGNYGLNNIGENIKTINLNDYPGLEKIYVSIDADGYMYDETKTITITDP